MAHRYNGISISHEKNGSESAAAKCMNLEPVVHGEVSEKEKNRCHILMHIYGI